MRPFKLQIEVVMTVSGTKVTKGNYRTALFIMKKKKNRFLPCDVRMEKQVARKLNSSDD